MNMFKIGDRVRFGSLEGEVRAPDITNEKIVLVLLDGADASLPIREQHLRRLWKPQPGDRVITRRQAPADQSQGTIVVWPSRWKASVSSAPLVAVVWDGEEIIVSVGVDALVEVR